MAEEILVKDALTREMIEAGKEFMHSLERAKFEFSSLFWLYTAEANNWKLTVVTPMVDREGPRKTYSVLGKVLRGMPSLTEYIDPLTITALSPNESLVTAIAGANAIHDLTGRRMTKANFGGIYVEDIYIYFVDESIRAYISSFTYERPRNSPK